MWWPFFLLDFTLYFCLCSVILILCGVHLYEGFQLVVQVGFAACGEDYGSHGRLLCRTVDAHSTAMDICYMFGGWKIPLICLGIPCNLLYIDI